MKTDDKFLFEISLSVLNHLGRNLYRSFITVLGEAISNAWDADAPNVWIYVDKEKNSFVIKDDGTGMSGSDFQNKFLKIGYSKRKDGAIKSAGGRPYIGRKGIGKLALLSCANKITIISKTEGGKYVGGVIDNSRLDDAIKQDLTPAKCPLGAWESKIFEKYTDNHERGTIIHFESTKDVIKNSSDHLKKTIALYFRFSLLDNSFNIFLNDEKITYEHLKDLAEKTEFLWKTNNIRDPYIDKGLTNLKEQKKLSMGENIEGFIASVDKPRTLSIIAAGERVGIDLFVNGRLREKDILKHMPTDRIPESYLYGQIHFNGLDDPSKDRFATNREGIVADDPKYKKFLDEFKKVIEIVIKDWDTWRRKHRQDGNPEDESITKKERKSEELYNVVSGEYVLPKDSKNKKEVGGWVDDLCGDARYNFASYAECFISENLIRRYIQEKNIPLTDEAKRDITGFKEKEARNKRDGNINIDLRKGNTDLSYLGMNGLAYLVEEERHSQNCLPSDSKQYKPIRDALMHTALLTDEAKRKLTTVYENIKGRVKALLRT